MKTTDSPHFQEFTIKGVIHISPADAMETLTANDAVLIDVREESEVKMESVTVDNVLYHPMTVIIDRLQYIARDQNIILVCNVGLRSTKVANLLNLKGYPHVANLDGGIMAWKAAGFPVTINPSSGSACGCGCFPS